MLIRKTQAKWFVRLATLVTLTAMVCTVTTARAADATTQDAAFWKKYAELVRRM